jgi:HTH-like domain
MLQERLSVSERRACRVTGQHHSTQRHRPRKTDRDDALRAELRSLSRCHPRWGYRRAWASLREAGWEANRKKIQRVWREEGLRVQAASEREQLIASTYAAFAERARGELASCPRCRKPLRGSDLVVSGHCPNCDEDLTSLLVPSRFGSLVTTEYLALLGALGVLAGLALRASAER